MTSQFQILNKILQNKDYSFITLNKYSRIIFYNRQAAPKRLLEIEKANADLVKRGNDI